MKVKIENQLISIEGKKGKLERHIPLSLKAQISEGKLLLTRRKDERMKVVELQGLFRTLISNMIQGVNEGYEKVLQVIGVGYRAKVEGQKLSLLLGFSHPKEVEIPKGLEVKVSAPNISIKGIDKELVGNFAASIRRIQPPDVYKGKGVRYQGEYIRHKVGKTAAATTTAA